MQVKSGKSLQTTWGWPVISLALSCLLMASSLYAQEARPPGLVDDERHELIGSWTPMVKLRDNSDTWPGRKPEGGWWVTAVHATLLPDGKVIFVGTSRIDERRVFTGHDQKHTSMENGISFVLSRLRSSSKII